MQKKEIRGTKTRVVKKPRQKAITLTSLQRVIAARDETIEELNRNCSRYLREAEKAEKEAINARGERDEYKRQFDRVATIMEFRLTTKFPSNTHGAVYDVQYNPVSQNQQEMPEEQRVLGELLDMVRNVQLKREYSEMGETVMGRNY